MHEQTTIEFDLHILDRKNLNWCTPFSAGSLCNVPNCIGQYDMYLLYAFLLYICFRYHILRICYMRYDPPPHDLAKSQIWSPPFHAFWIFSMSHCKDMPSTTPGSSPCIVQPGPDQPDPSCNKLNAIRIR